MTSMQCNVCVCGGRGGGGGGGGGGDSCVGDGRRCNFRVARVLKYNKAMLKCGLCFSVVKSCGPPNEINSFVGPRLKKFAEPCDRVSCTIFNLFLQ